MNLDLGVEVRFFTGKGGPELMARPAEVVSAVQHIRKMRGGSQAQLLRASDHQFYVTKFRNNPQHIRILANEYLGSKLGTLLGLPMPEVAAIDVSEWLINNTPQLAIETSGMFVPCAAGLQLGSRYAAEPQEALVFDYLPEPMFKRVANREDFPRVLAFDKWTCNSDGRQAVFVKQPKHRFYHAVFIDQGYCFNAGEWSFPDSPLRGVFARNSAYEGVTGWRSFEPALSQVKQIDPAALWNIVHEIPEEWYQSDSEGMSRLIDALHSRQSLIPKLITSFRTSTRNPFPNWTATVSRPLDAIADKTDKEEIREVTDSKLKAVFILNPETQTFKPTAHNLGADLAMEQFSADPNARVIDQTELHRNSHTSKCRACKKQAEELTTKHAEEAHSSEQEEEATAQESESD